MRRTGLLLSLAAALCAHAAAAVVVYNVDLNGPNENPPNASPGTGTATITFDTIANTMAVHVDFSGLLGTTLASHIHCCTAAPMTGPAGVATQTPTFEGFPLGVMAGTYDRTFDLLDPTTYNTNPGAFFESNGGTAAGAEAALLAGAAAGRAYLNIHSSVVPGGEIRGFLVQTPEPATFAITGLGLVGALVARKRLARG